MPVVKQVTYYSFDELSEQAQQKVIETVRQWDDLFHSDEEFVLEQFSQKHPHIHDMDISYSGFCSQGDGASFTGYIDGNFVMESLLPEKLKNLVRDIDCWFVRNSTMYCHEQTVSSDMEDILWADHIEENDKLRDTMLSMHFDTILGAIEEYRLNLCHELYAELEQAYEYCHSDENIKELILANDYLFDADGNFQ